jgi:hypothetical protein
VAVCLLSIGLEFSAYKFNFTREKELIATDQKGCLLALIIIIETCISVFKLVAHICSDIEYIYCFIQKSENFWKGSLQKIP